MATKTKAAPRPLSLERVVALLNKAFREAEFEETVTADQVRGVYEITTSAYDIIGLLPTGNDANVRQILRWIPDEKSGNVVIASIKVRDRKDGSDPASAPDYVPTMYWIFDFDLGEVMTDFDAFKRYHIDVERKATRA